jgi:16S rRNA (guanine966-N2)-methyltransferase
MRIISGSLGGRTFDSPGTFKTHPMSDKARGALFNILGDIEGLTFLDAFAGTGALSFEAVSRGAASSLAIEQDKAAQRVVLANIKTLGLGRQVKLIQASAGAWLSTSTDSFDVVVCDPPYNDLQFNLIERLAERVRADGLLVLSWPESTEIPEIDGLRLLDHRGYGDATLAFYRQIQ